MLTEQSKNQVEKSNPSNNQFEITCKPEIIYTYQTIREVDNWLLKNETIDKHNQKKLDPSHVLSQIYRVQETEKVFTAFETFLRSTKNSIEEVRDAVYSGFKKLEIPSELITKKESWRGIPKLLKEDIINSYFENLAKLNQIGKEFKPNDEFSNQELMHGERKEQLIKLEKRMQAIKKEKELPHLMILLEYQQTHIRTMNTDYFYSPLIDKMYSYPTQYNKAEYLSILESLADEAKNRLEIQYSISKDSDNRGFVNIKGKLRKY